MLVHRLQVEIPGNSGSDTGAGINVHKGQMSTSSVVSLRLQVGTRRQFNSLGVKEHQSCEQR